MSEPLYPGARLRDTLRDSWRIWRHRWAILGAFGLTEERFHAWPLPAQRAFIAACVGAVLLVIVGPFSGVDLSALITFAIFVALYVPSWKRLGRAGRWVIPGAFLALFITHTAVSMRPARRSVTMPLLSSVQKLARAATSPARSPTPNPSASITPRPT